jgi:hypothetical protein
MALQIQTAPTGVVRDAHYVIPTGASEPVRTLLTEPQRTNLCIRSQEFNLWNNNGVTVTADNAIAPDGTATADTLAATTAVTNYRLLTVTFTGDGEKCASVFLKQGTAASSAVELFESSPTPASRHQVLVTWTAGVPTLSTIAGAGTRYPPQAMGNGWWRIMFSATGILAASTNRIHVYPDRTTTTGTVLAWGAQAENAIVPSSYTPTEAAAVVRNADSLYWEIASLVPQELTAYVRGVFLGTEVNNRVFHIGGDAASVNPRWTVFRGSVGFASTWDNGTDTSNTVQTTPAPALFDVVEWRATLSSAGLTGLGVSINSATEVLGTTGTARALGAAFVAARFYLNSAGTSNYGLLAATNIGIFRGTRDRAYCRANTGVV